MSQPNSRTQIEELGEFGLIEYLTKNLQLRQPGSILGPGDDAAVISSESGEKILITTDMLMEGVHFDLTYVPLKHLGYKAVTVNLSDICAMNGIPRQITVSLGFSNRFTLEAIDQLYQGIYLACQHYNVDLIGGDTTSSLQGLVISITATGTAKSEEIVYRSGAKNNDLIVVSGNLGAAYMGLQLLEREKHVFFETGQQVQPQLDGYEYLLERQLKPEARIDLRDKLSSLGIKPTSMIDISDGLSSEMLHICKKSGCGCTIYEEKIPVHEDTKALSKEFGLDASTCALNGGEDYEMLFTIDLKDFDKIKDVEGLSIIGHINEIQGGCNLITRSETVHPLTAQGWNAFNQEEKNQEKSEKG